MNSSVDMHPACMGTDWLLRERWELIVKCMFLDLMDMWVYLAQHFYPGGVQCENRRRQRKAHSGTDGMQSGSPTPSHVCLFRQALSFSLQ